MSAVNNGRVGYLVTAGQAGQREVPKVVFHHTDTAHSYVFLSVLSDAYFRRDKHRMGVEMVLDV